MTVQVQPSSSPLPPSLDRATIEALLLVDRRAILSLCSKMADDGDASLATLLLDIEIASPGLGGADNPLSNWLVIPSNLLSSDTGHEAFALRWMDHTREGDINDSLMKSVMRRADSLSILLVQEGADPCTMMTVDIESELPLPSIGGINVTTAKIEASSPLAMMVLENRFMDASMLNNLLEAMGDGLLNKVPEGFRFQGKGNTSLLTALAVAANSGYMVSTVLKHCDPNQPDVKREILCAIEELALLRETSQCGLGPADPAMSGITELLSFCHDMDRPLNLPKALADRFTYRTTSSEGGLPHILVESGREFVAARALMALQKMGIDIMTRDSNGATVLHKAAEAGYTHLVQTLLEAGMSTKEKDNKGGTPEASARRAKQFDTMAMLQSLDARSAIFAVAQTVRRGMFAG